MAEDDVNVDRPKEPSTSQLSVHAVIDRMVALEDHGQDWNVEEFITHLYRFAEDPDTVGKAINAQVKRAMELATDFYGKVVFMDSRNSVLIGFLQGATFGAAAEDVRRRSAC